MKPRLQLKRHCPGLSVQTIFSLKLCNLCKTVCKICFLIRVGKQRKQRLDFPGASVIMDQIKDKSKVSRRRIGLMSREGPPMRSHMEIQTLEGQTLGEVTSGCPSPSMAPMNVAMGYVKGEQVSPGTKVNIKVRNKIVTAEIVKMPFLKGKYFMPPKN